MDNLRFTKMHGIGNDFAVVNATQFKFSLEVPTIAQLANRYTGIGFDQLLVVEPSEKADFFCRIYNADGSEAEQCGNGLRCVARYVVEEGLTQQSHLHLETKAGVFSVVIHDLDHISVTMNAPIIQNALTELLISAEHQQIQKLMVSIISVGNPHVVLKVPSASQALVDTWGQALSTHETFPNGANVGFMEIVNRHHIRLRTFERGSGETHACGSNACASAVAGIVNGWLDHEVKVEFRLGTLVIQWKQGEAIVMTGGASRVYEGVVSTKAR